MKDYCYINEYGHEIPLSENTMMAIKNYYEVQSTADYLRENHEEWSEEEIQKIAYETRELMHDYDYTEEEAIKEAVKKIKGE